MTLLAAILTLTATASLAAPPGPVAVDGVEAIEHVPLPETPVKLALRVRALEALVVIETSSRSAPELVRAIRRAPRTVCAGLDESPFEIRLRCRSKRIVARLVPHEGGYLLEISETRGLPWDGEDAPALVAFDPPSLALGGPCPGSTPAGRAECLLAQGDRSGARATLEQITDGPTLELAELRLGDLALAAGEARLAAQAWGRIQDQPWQRLAAARLCEASWSCLTGVHAESIYATEGLPQPLARDLTLRRARARAFLGRAGEGARSLLSESTGVGACAAAPSLCRRVALAALHAPGSDAIDGLLLWLETQDRDHPSAYEAEVAAAAAAERNGAPLFGANVLAAAAGRAPAHAFGEHLLRTAELYLAGGDRVRAGVVLEFARARTGKKGLTGPRWTAVARGTSGSGEPSLPAHEHALVHLPDDGFLAAAGRSAQAARALFEGGRP